MQREAFYFKSDNGIKICCCRWLPDEPESPRVVSVPLCCTPSHPTPDSADELLRVDGSKQSYKLLIARPGGKMKIMCGEISEQADKPGMDIFQEGALLGSYNYKSHQECMNNFTKTIWAHLWEKGPWSLKDRKRYTMNRLTRVTELGRSTVPVEENFSYLHSSP